ncbi:1727_t:CDS:2 [Ambispora gerdemannii]|uniref:1727_t:CDS:1 n=1 Tax=Ambispora gerdemannii TaxID=144530 RepID=A0A9N9BYM9_9GLOM|nr:1727_t:CDS:2 [Ambispora gerdemannii]
MPPSSPNLPKSLTAADQQAWASCQACWVQNRQRLPECAKIAASEWQKFFDITDTDVMSKKVTLVGSSLTCLCSLIVNAQHILEEECKPCPYKLISGLASETFVYASVLQCNSNGKSKIVMDYKPPVNATTTKPTTTKQTPTSVTIQTISTSVEPTTPPKSIPVNNNSNVGDSSSSSQNTDSSASSNGGSGSGIGGSGISVSAATYPQINGVHAIFVAVIVAVILLILCLDRLKQDDFRKLLQTPRPGEAPVKGSLGSAISKHRIAPPATPKVTFADIPASRPKKTHFRKPIDATTDFETTETNKYRDRAAERRKGANPDYQETEQILKALNKSETLEAKTIYEQSKYLGGDTEHTHLVKGLDFALLAKVRNELDQEGSGSGTSASEKDDELEAVLRRLKEETEEKPRINSRLAQNIYDFAVIDAKKKPPKVNELFIAGRMAYIFELADEMGDYGDPFAIPTTVIRSKADINDINAEDKTTNDLVIEKISQPEEVRMVRFAAIDDSEDIFAEAGRDYESASVEEKLKTKDEEEESDEDTGFVGPLFPAAAGKSKLENEFNKPNYFDDYSQQQDEEDKIDIDKNNKPIDYLIEQASIGIKDTHLKKKLVSHDSYEGDYSTYGLGMSSTISGTRESAYESGHSDSDSDGTRAEHTIRDQGVTKNKKAQLSRWDFDTEEEWQEYKDNVTAMPKSAFQFGVKTGDGRKTRRSGKELTEKQKIDRDWQKIKSYKQQEKRWPNKGRHILVNWSDETVLVYQAYRPSIADYAIQNQKLGGPDFSITRMTWIKTNFTWMMHRSKWATKVNQERILGIHIKHSGFLEILRAAVSSTFGHSFGVYENEEEWKQTVKQSDVIFQWDPDYNLDDKKLQRRAIQLGIRGEMLNRFLDDFVVRIEDMTPFVRETFQEKLRIDGEGGDTGDLCTVVERPYFPLSEDVKSRLGVNECIVE